MALENLSNECRRCKAPRGLNLSGKEDRAGNRYAVLLRCFFHGWELGSGLSISSAALFFALSAKREEEEKRGTIFLGGNFP